MLFQYSDESNQDNRWTNYQNIESSSVEIVGGKTSNIDRFNLCTTNQLLVQLCWHKIIFFVYYNAGKIEENEQWTKYDNNQSSKLD